MFSHIGMDLTTFSKQTTRLTSSKLPLLLTSQAMKLQTSTLSTFTTPSSRLPQDTKTSNLSQPMFLGPKRSGAVVIEEMQAESSSHLWLVSHLLWFQLQSFLESCMRRKSDFSSSKELVVLTCKLTGSASSSLTSLRHTFHAFWHGYSLTRSSWNTTNFGVF